MKSICVFCGSSSGSKEIYAEEARRMGETLVRRGLRLVYGGGRVGLMGEVGRAVLAAGGYAIGIIPEALMRKELAYEDLSELHVVRSMHERKAMMADLADAFVALPGGFGTFEEFCEVLTWAQLGFHAKPVALLNTAGYYDPLLALFEHAVTERFVRPEHRAMVLARDEPDALLDALERYHAPKVEKWLRPETT